jgi:pimeloyl-ACP methyl ester carboxylesterase
LSADLARLDTPALLVAGGADQRSLEATRALAAVLPRAELRVIDGGGHVVNLTNPAEFNAALDNFLGRVGGPINGH